MDRKLRWWHLVIAAVVLLGTGVAFAGGINKFNEQEVVLRIDDGGKAGSAENPIYMRSTTSDPIAAAQVGLTTLPQGSVPSDGGAGDAATQPATEIPPGDAGFTGRTSLTLQNLGTGVICCGFDPGVTCATGIQIDGSPDGVAAGGSITLTVSQGVKVYCWSQSGQVAPGNVRWIQSR